MDLIHCSGRSPSSSSLFFSVLNCRAGFLLPRRPFQVQRQQSAQYVFIAQIMRPAISIEDGGIELLVRQVQPGGGAP